MEVNERLKVYIKEHGFTQTGISEKSGIELKTLNAILNGNVRLTVDRLVAICKAMNVDPAIFLEGYSNNIGTDEKNAEQAV